MTSSPRMLGDRYELGAVLGRGGTADVFAAYDHVLERDVAVKLLREATEVDRARFASEVRLMRMLHHPHVVSVLDTGTDGGRPWLVLELVEGIPLDVVMGEVPMEAARVAAIGAQVAGALAHAHAHGIVHRDVKPSNVLIAPGDRAKLTDFGIARRTDSASVTLTGHTIGTAAYLAPEQVAGEDVCETADVYALGLVLLEALTGRREYDGPPVEAALTRLQRSPAVPASLPPGWSSLISTMTTRLPTQRPPASEVASRLTALAGGSAVADTSVTQVTALFSVGRAPVAARHRTAMAAACSAAAGFVLAGTLLLAGGADEQPASASETGASATTKPSPRAKASAKTPKPAPSTNVPATAAAATTTESPAPVARRPVARQQTGTRQDRAGARAGTADKKKSKAGGSKGKQGRPEKAKSGKGRR